MRFGLPAVQPSGVGDRVPALFYRAFEDRHRGPRELIKARQRVYLPFIEPLRSIYRDAKAIDLGCGRGEWLELLQDAGFDARGVDQDDNMLAACRELGLNAAAADALAALKALPDESQLVVSGFHIAEHIQFSDLQTLVQEALRVLKPAGLLILETPNPENMVVGTVNFYLDPTHQKPIPPELLSFLPEYYGFAKVKVVRLQEDKALSGKAWISLLDVLAGVSPDYAVISQKSADASLLSLTKDAFAQDYGLTLDSLAKRFDQQTEKVAQVQAQNQQAQDRVAQVQAQNQQAQDRAAQAQAMLIQVTNSRSWRITAPLRWLATRFMQRGLMRPPRKLVRKALIYPTVLLQHVALYVRERPRLKNAAWKVLHRFPRLKRSLFQVITVPVQHQNLPMDMAHFNPRVRQIYADLKTAIAHLQKKYD